MRILLVEDDPALAQTLEASLSYAHIIVDWVASLHEARVALSTQTYQAMVLDLGLPDGNGCELVRSLRLRKNSLPILILTARDGLEERINGLDSGADDYLIKPLALSELLARLRALIRRAQGHNQSHRVWGKLSLDWSAQRAYVEQVPLDLSAREWTVLAFLALHANKIISKNQIIQNISGLGEDLSENAIEMYVHRLRQKLGHSGMSIRTIRGLGYLFEESKSQSVDGELR
jgi:two-component system OmpR family response regulator